MKPLISSRVVAPALILIATIAPCARAQDAPSVRTGTVEIGGFAGVSDGLDHFRIMGGGNVSYGVTKWLLPYGEFSYFPAIARSLNVNSGGLTQNITYDVPLYDLHAGVHLRIPIKESKVVPYGVFGVGIIRSSFNGNATFTFTQNGVPTSSQKSFSDKNTDGAVNFGGGLRYYVNEKFGFRFEAKVYRPFSGLYDNFVGKIEGGIFYQLH
jgi:hypothetical protein